MVCSVQFISWAQDFPYVEEMPRKSDSANWKGDSQLSEFKILSYIEKIVFCQTCNQCMTVGDYESMHQYECPSGIRNVCASIGIH